MKYKQNDPFVVRHLINKELEQYKVDYDYVNDVNFREKHSCEWYEYYRFNTKQDYDEWKNYCVAFLTTNITPKISKKRALEIFAWLDLMWGLKHNYEN
jgi:hypothetical protein